MTTLDDIRGMTPDIYGYAYFQTSGFSPKLAPVVDEVVRWFSFHSQGPAIPEIAARMQELADVARAGVADVLNADSEEIMLGENATIGINVVANGIDWKSGDNLILSSHEHPGNRLVWYNIARLHDVELRFVEMTDDQDRMREQLTRLIDNRTRIVSISHVSRRTGVRVAARDLVRIAHERDVPLLYDGAQSVGAIPVDVRAIECDFYVFSGHKYLMASQGTGGMYIRKDRIDWLRPVWIGSRSQKDFDLQGNMELLDNARRFEFGTRNLPDQIGLGKALEIWKSVGWENVFDAIRRYTDRMKQRLEEIPRLVLETPLPYDRSSGIVTFRLPGHESGAVLQSLQENEKILGSSLEFDSEGIRLSTHVFNTEEHLERLVSGLQRILRTGR
ncbi:MAG: aminotransferase class V-fold PLP-dependent enzyme [candidate division Zixibacteria bacterium]|nr:aminotransferase class V-fold PLP-dependent enzyme [candidate division Zixibacteria bacterium]